MKAIIIMLASLFLTMPTAPVAEEAVQVCQSYQCPECSCGLFYKGDLWCQGIKCVHYKIYHCGCCGKDWKVIAD